MLCKLKKKGLIDKLIFEKTNTLFAKGNNIASKHCDKESKYILLLNSDIEIRDKYWLKYLQEGHKRGATSYGLCDNYPHIRGDGYCILIDRDLYLKYQLDEKFEWWWSVTKLQAQLLNDGYAVTAVKEHELLLHHYGGMSGNAAGNASGMTIEGIDVKRWFESGEVKVIPKLLVENNRSFNELNLTNFYTRVMKEIKKAKALIRRVKK